MYKEIYIDISLRCHVCFFNFQTQIRRLYDTNVHVPNNALV